VLKLNIANIHFSYNASFQAVVYELYIWKLLNGSNYCVSVYRQLNQTAQQVLLIQFNQIAWPWKLLFFIHIFGIQLGSFDRPTFFLLKCTKKWQVMIFE
jgi:hypothetical protein